VEKLVYLSRTRAPAGLREALRADSLLRAFALQVTTSTSATQDANSKTIVSAWFTSLDRRGPFEAHLLALGLHMDGYLVTESRITRSAPSAEGDAAVLLLLRQASRFGQAELRGRTEQLLVPGFAGSAADVTCDAVVRPLSGQAPPLRQLWTLRRPIFDPDHDWPVQLASIALPEEYEIERGVIVHTWRA